MSNEFIEYYQIPPKMFQDMRNSKNNNVIEFKTHSKLDEFCNYLNENDKEFNNKFKYEWILLKGLYFLIINPLVIELFG
jgi:hypothetical protein